MQLGKCGLRSTDQMRVTDGSAAPVAVAIMAKAPRAGEVKTRLCPPLSHAEAAELYRCFLLDKLAQVRAVAGARAVLAFTPDDERGLFGQLAPDFQLVGQGDGDLGRRLLTSIGGLLGDGYTGALAIDSDTPSLPIAFLERAVDLVTTPDIDVVLGPCDDGGYYLIGMRRVWPTLFEAIPWSTAHVLTETARRAEAEGLRVACLPTWFDVDTPEDLERLTASLAAPDSNTAYHTRRFLERRAR